MNNLNQNLIRVANIPGKILSDFLLYIVLLPDTEVYVVLESSTSKITFWFQYTHIKQICVYM